MDQQVGVAFSRNAKRVVIFLAGFAIVAFAVGSDFLLRAQAQRSLQLRIDTYRAALAMSADPDLGGAVTRLRACTSGLVGLATISGSGTLVQVHPDDRRHHALAEMALQNEGKTIEVNFQGENEPLLLYGALVDLPLSSPHRPDKVLLLVRRASYRLAWFKALLVVSAGVSAMAALRFYTLNRWFIRRVVAPLREFSRLNIDPQTALAQLPALDAGAWQETTQIARQFELLLRTLNDSDTRIKQLEQESRRQILHKERGFDIRLKRVKDEATIDPLTKLRNRAFLESDLESLFQKHQDRKSNLCAVMLDVDNFKRYNDTHGHQAGDALLRFIGSLLRGGIRPVDYAVRYGGDEFLLLLPDLAASEGSHVAQRLIKLFAQYAGQLSRECGVSMSAGVACYPDDPATDGHELVNAADAALYSAKHGGKNSVATATQKTPPPPAKAQSSPAAAAR